MDTYLIYCNFIGGHQLEYVHHLYIGAIKHPENVYFFLVPSDFYKVSNKFDWPNANNISIKVIDNQDIPSKTGGLLKKVYTNCKALRKYVKQYNATHVILISLIEFLPFLPFLLSPSVKVRGILYRIYLYEWRKEGKVKKAQDVIKFKILSKCRVFERVYILNDKKAASVLNKLYTTNKFRYLTDPIVVVDSYHSRNIRTELEIDSEKRIFLHPGGMLRRKGTLEILKALVSLDEDICQKIVVIFAGRVTVEIEEEFRNLYERAKNKVQLVLMEGYLPFERLADLFETSDYVLIPYTDNSKSSGIIGHAAYYHRPVIVAQGGIIGKIVKKWGLGYLLKKADAKSIKEFIKDLPCGYQYNEEYVKTHSIEAFYTEILKNS